MTPADFIRFGLDPALALLPRQMDTPEARAMIIAICLQESGLLHRRQLGGPARGFAQFEQGGGVKGVLAHRSSKAYAVALCEALSIPVDIPVVYEALAWNDVLAAGFARLLLWTLPQPLPSLDDEDGAWAQYIDAWRPGKPHRDRWRRCWPQATECLA